MKRYMKKIAVALLAVMLFSALASYAYAANTEFNNFRFTAHAGDYVSAPDVVGKTNSTPMVVYIDSSSIGGSHFVRANGRTSETSMGNNNCTVYNNQLVDHVICNEGTFYSIKNVIRENGYAFAVPTIANRTSYGTVSGKWAPDSAQTYSTPLAP